MPRHFGNSAHPQNGTPAFSPFFVTRFTITPPHWGQFGASIGMSDVGEGV
ncbi:hypothetical protein SAMN05421755_10321 [Nitrosomonas sp. Nm33]|nr:hypothetical protein [Nitrosomonas sp. Nm33]SDY59082.1 hypothetical protein SAMN05421755_10321 [Nitrosomonas sp. Nm33]